MANGLLRIIFHRCILAFIPEKRSVESSKNIPGTNGPPSAPVLCGMALQSSNWLSSWICPQTGGAANTKRVRKKFFMQSRIRVQASYG